MDGLYVEGISKTYGSVAVVNDVSFHASQGKILGLLGPNGAGKTTILRMIMGITAPDRGGVFFRQGSSQTQGIPRSAIGYLPEERGLYREAKVLSVLVFLAGLKNVPRPEAKRRALHWLRKFGLEEYAHKTVEQLSKGMAQKVQFAAAVLHEPRFVVLDEPFSGLDPVSQDLFKAEIRELANAGAVVLLSSHQMNFVEELCDEIFLIHRGREVVKGDLQSIRERYGSFRVDVELPPGLKPKVREELVETWQELNQGSYRYILREGVQPLQFVQSLPADLPIHELTINRPTLHDIFVRVAQGGAGHEE